MAVEIERKFLVKDGSWQQEQEGTPLLQGYMKSGDGLVVRVRIAGNQAFLTIKGKTTGFSRLEFEYPIPMEDAKEILSELCTKPIISKVRYKIPYDGKMWEVDVFDDENHGLVLAEIELADEKESFAMPNWVGEEVSEDKRYRNNYLAAHPFTTWGNE